MISEKNRTNKLKNTNDGINQWSQPYRGRSDLRKNFGLVDVELKMPCMIKVQLNSYAEFLQKDVLPENRKNIGLQAIFNEYFPVQNNSETIRLSFISYQIENCTYSPMECKDRGITYAGPLKVNFELFVKDGEEISSQEKGIYLGEIPLMTNAGTFIINGTERTVIAQLHRSPGIFVEKIEDELGSSCLSRVIPTKGLWIDFEMEVKGPPFVLINKKRLPLAQLLLVLTPEEPNKSAAQSILELLCPLAKIEVSKVGDGLKGAEHIGSSSMEDETRPKYFLYEDLLLDHTCIAPAGTALTEQIIALLPQNHAISIIDIHAQYALFALRAIQSMKITDRSLINAKLTTLLRPNEQQSKGKPLADVFQRTFFDEERYSLSDIGRAKLNYKLGLNKATLALSMEDIVLIVRNLFAVVNGDIPPDNPDSLMHRRVRSVGELVGNQVQQAVAKMVKFMQEKMVFSSASTITLSELINSKHLVAVIREFFGTSQLSQMQDQTSELSRVAHMRRLTACGPGGLKRDRAFADVRGLHPTHYGRICFNESPEGPALGLVLSQSLFSDIDGRGFICTPYKKVVDGKITDEVEYLSCIQEIGKVIAHYDAKSAVAGKIEGDLIDCRKNNAHYLASPSEVTHIDLTPKQLISLSGSLLPFMNHCDAARAVMGSNMQRQALPLINPTAPLIGTGMERVMVDSSSLTITAKKSGTVAYVSSSTIIVENNDTSDSISTTYKLVKFDRSNDTTVINQTPRVKVGDTVEAGDILAVCEAVDDKEIALGRNLRTAFLSWKGYNYEDAIVISSEAAKKFSSLSLTKYEVSIRDLRYGVEQWTRDLPNVPSHLTECLDADGIINVGTHVKPGDILVGKITPKAEVSSTPAERLIRAVFGTKGVDVDDTSLRVPPKVKGTVVAVKVLSKEGAPKNKRIIEIEKEMVASHIRERDLQIKVLTNSFKKKMGSALINLGVSEDEIQASNADALIALARKVKNSECIELSEKFKEEREFIIHECKRQCEKELAINSLPAGIVQTIQIFIATKFMLQVGDKMAGRHGNKGIVSTILNESEMPFTADGKPVEIIFTSTAISGRMNIGQILEAHLGWASVHLGAKAYQMAIDVEQNLLSLEELRAFLLKIYDKPSEQEAMRNRTAEELIYFAKELKDGVPFACPAFEGPSKDRIRELLELAGCDPSGKSDLYNPDTGDKFPQPVTVGMLYVQQLHHLVDRKEHARAVGPYSVITQQPLGGRAQQGGQRLGEMECWALQAHSAAYTIREMLTVKSDCPASRSRIFQLVSYGYDLFNAKGIPEAFAVLIYELRGLGLNVECLKFTDGQFVPHEVHTITEFDALRIRIASPEDILRWSYGEVKKPETIHYKTFRPHVEGIFSTKIFGPIKDNQCLCGKHKGFRKKGVICSKCQTEVTLSSVRRHRCGHITLASPVAHVWFAKVLPSRIAISLDMSNANLNKILKLEYYIVTQSGLSPKAKGSVISEAEYFATMHEYGDTGFVALTGPEALDVLLKSIDLKKEISLVKHQLSSMNNLTTKDKLLKRLEILEAFDRNGSKLDSMIIKVLSVIPPDFRPLVTIDGGRFASSDLNDLYRRVINRNNRLLKMLSYQTPYIIIKNEKRMLQEAVDALFDNSRRSQPVVAANKRPLKSLTDSLKGKHGRFRENLLGKRVDYSGRTVIVVGPYLKLNQCGLPKSMAFELFKPHLNARLILRGFASNPKAAKLMIERNREEVLDSLQELIAEYVVLLNRAPTLHRLGIQAFKPILVEGKAIHLNPMTCVAFNADFDGDMMAVHVPLSVESQIEARNFMMSTKCIINPANASIIASPAKDIVLGIYSMTSWEPGFKGDGMRFSSFAEADHAFGLGLIRYSTPIKVLLEGKMVDTTYGRMELYQCLPEKAKIPFEHVNRTLVSKDIKALLHDVYSVAGEDAAVDLINSLMKHGFKYATECGASFAYSDLPVPKDKEKIVSETKKAIGSYYKQYQQGLILREDLYNKIVSAWTQCTETLSKHLLTEMCKTTEGQIMNPVTAMMLSGARGSESQIRQLSAIKGLVVKNDGSLYEIPVVNSFIEGVSVSEHMINSQGARKSLTDIAFKTADAGYFTRRLAAVAQDVVTKTYDCGTSKHIEIKLEGSHLAPLHERAFGRTAAEDIFDDNILLVKAGEIINKDACQKLQESSVTKIKIRSPLTCEAEAPHICCKCYGYDLSTLAPIQENIAIGIIAAQSIGEPGTQLTMKNFQGGGAAQNVMSDNKLTAVVDAVLNLNNGKTAIFEGKRIVISKNNLLTLVNSRGDIVDEHRLPQGTILHAENGSAVKKGGLIAEWSGYVSPIIAEQAGKVVFKDILPGTSCREAFDGNTGAKTIIITQELGWLNPMIIIGDTEYPLQAEDTIVVQADQMVEPGQLLAERIKTTAKSQDIIGGLEKVMLLFEAGKPKNQCVLSHVDGFVEIKNTGDSSKISIKNENEKRDYAVPKGAQIIVSRGDYVKAGDPLTSGKPCAHDILKIHGLQFFARWIINEIQSVYKMQGIRTAEVHFEVAIKQMLRSGTIINPGDTSYIVGEKVDLNEAEQINEILNATGKDLVVWEQNLLGITRATIAQKRSFMSAASFQETPKILIDAALEHATDCMTGIKPPMMAGQLVPIGVGGLVRDIKNMEYRNAMVNSVMQERIRHILRRDSENTWSEEAPAPLSKD